MDFQLNQRPKIRKKKSPEEQTDSLQSECLAQTAKTQKQKFYKFYESDGNFFQIKNR